MKPNSVLLAVVAVILIVSLVCIWFYPSVQDLAAANNAWNGIKDTMSELDAETITSLDDLPDAPQNTALIAVPNKDYSDGEMAQLQQFVGNGGRLVLVDDYGYGNRVLEHLGVKITFAEQPLLDPLFCYQNQQMPRSTDFSSQLQEMGISVVTLDRATALSNVDASEAIAWSSPSSFLDLDNDGSWQEGEPKGPLPVAAEFRLGSGTVDVVASPGMMINSLYGKDDNLLFLKYLTGHEAGTERILVDSSHLSTAPLDVSKIRLLEIRQMLSNPYAALGILLLVFLAVSVYMLKKGDVLGSTR
ncbi:MAG: DUF4350 domain-containing protein [Dehalococcoidia bacterium]|nr:DUF4350 domain-containing protein [Dehalococcoidia bacterium]